MDEIDNVEPGVVVASREGFTDLEIARMIGRVLTNAANTLGLAHDGDTHLQDLCGRIIVASQRGGIDSTSYWLAWTVLGWCDPLHH
jgi:hypothetical protein